MPDLLKIALLAVIQGVTEFLPVSSSGHLGLATHWLAFRSPGILLEVTTHVGTLISVWLYYRKMIRMRVKGLANRDPQSMSLLGLLVVSSIPIAIVGLLFRHRVEALFDNPHVIACMLIITGCVLLSLFKPSHQDAPLSRGRALAMGLAQAVAVLPGISRSGMTITMARHLGIAPARAAEFALLMMFPAIGGALVISLGDVCQSGLGELTIVQLLTALVISATVGYGSICVLIKTLNSGRFKWFGFYCLAAGIAALIAL